MPRDIDIAWAAGLFEGEGCIGVNKRAGTRSRPFVQWNLQLTSTDFDTIAKFRQVVGRGLVHARPPQPRRKPQQIWGVYDRNGVAEVLRMFLPYLCQRRHARAKECLDDISKMSNGKGESPVRRSSKYRRPVQLTLPGILDA